MKRLGVFIPILLTFLLAFSIIGNIHAQQVTQIAMAIDGSGSISSGDWTIILNGIANAVENNLPHDGSVELTVVQFTTGLSGRYNDGTYTYEAKVEIPPTVITAANYAAIATTIRGLSQGNGNTPIADGIWVGWLSMLNSPNFGTSNKQVINVATDGGPNVRWSNVNLRDPGGNAGTDVPDARDAAVAAGLDELDAEAIGAGAPLEAMRDLMVWPQPGTIAPPFTPGWVQYVADAAEFSSAIGEKFERISEPEGHPVGGYFIPNNKLTILAPYIALVGLIGVLSSIFLMVKKHRA